MDVALVTCSPLPETDPDMAPLTAALTAARIDAAAVAWDDERVDWSQVRLAVLRSCWDYPHRLGAFTAWLETTAGACELWNPLPVVRWNLHKSYLLELARRGVPVTPTDLLPRGADTRLRALGERRGWGEVVIKPAVSGSSFATLRSAISSEEGERHLRRLLAERDVLVQPYLPAVEGYGERAVVWIDGEVTHAVRKEPRFAGQHEAVTRAAAVASEEAELARRTVSVVDGPLLYARVDVAPGLDGALLVMELELVEPSLYFAAEPRALARFVAAIERRLASRDGPLARPAAVARPQ